MAKLSAPVALVILDGWGVGDEKDANNAISQAHPKNMTNFFNSYPSTTLMCSGEAVGLPDGQMGNSEVGHLNIGAGRIVYQELTRISKDIRTKEFFSNRVLNAVCQQTKDNKGALHLMGLLSDGGVHSHIAHLYALLELAKSHNIAKVFVHAFLDGRDVPPSSAGQYIEELENTMRQMGIGCIATIAGRYYAMDRDKRWERVEKAYAAMVYRQGERADNAGSAIQAAYERGETDEFVLPTVIDCDENAAIKENDGVIFFNFRPDRARELTRALVDKEFTGFIRRGGVFNLFFAAMTQYDETIDVPVAYPPQYLRNTLGEVFSKGGYKQLRIAETEKYAHVTFFFSGGEEKPFEGEERILIPSPKVATYDLKPEMSALEVTDRLVEEIEKQNFDFIVLNFANGDMVGHTGKLDAAVKAVGIVDECVARVAEAMRKTGGITCITADHGNAEMMFDYENNAPYTAHTTNNVPFIILSDKHKHLQLRNDGILADIAPTVLALVGIEVPQEMSGKNLIIA